MNENEKKEKNTESIIQQDLRSYPSKSLKGFWDLSSEEQAEVIETIYRELNKNEENILSLALDKLEFMGSLLLPPYPLGEHEEVMKENRARLNRLHEINNWNDRDETEWMINENYDDLLEVEQKNGREARNELLLHKLAEKLATLIKDEIIERLEDLEI